MNRQTFANVILAYCLTLVSCDRKEATESGLLTSVPTETMETRAASETVIQIQIHPKLPDFTLTLVWDRSSEFSEPLHITRIEVRRAPAGEAFQIIEGLHIASPLSSGTSGVEVIDMNFDGYGDIRVIETQPAGPNVSYLNWLFDPKSDTFVENPALNAITAPQFDSATGEIRSKWRDGATRYGTDVYIFKEHQPVLVRKEYKVYKSPGIYTLQVSRYVDGVWKMIEQHDVYDP